MRKTRARVAQVARRIALVTSLLLVRATGRPLKTLLKLLRRAYGNFSYSARFDYLVAVGVLATGSSSILECGTGATTLLLNALRVRHGYRLLSLEQSSEWHKDVTRHLSALRLRSDTVLLAPLVSHDDDYDWYSTANIEGKFDLVVCDGPPGATKGGRYGLVPQLFDRLEPGTRILIDDSNREGEREVIARWVAGWPIRIVRDDPSGYAILVVET
jgi:hypothetical protein